MLVEAHKDKEFADIVNNSVITTLDGLPLTWGLRLLYGIKQDRVAGMDMLPDLLSLASKNQIPVFFYGGTEEVLTKTEAYIKQYNPDINTHTSALSNRFYCALIHKKPMIVTISSIQGDFVEKYNLGLAIENCSNLAEDIQDFIQNFNHSEFKKKCDYLMSSFMEDYQYFKARIISFIFE